jgi:hypothetical protein
MNLKNWGILLFIINKVIIHASVVNLGTLPFQINLHRFITRGVGYEGGCRLI